MAWTGGGAHHNGLATEVGPRELELHVTEDAGLDPDRKVEPVAPQKKETVTQGDASAAVERRQP